MLWKTSRTEKRHRVVTPLFVAKLLRTSAHLFCVAHDSSRTLHSTNDHFALRFRLPSSCTARHRCRRCRRGEIECVEATGARIGRASNVEVDDRYHEFGHAIEIKNSTQILAVAPRNHYSPISRPYIRLTLDAATPTAARSKGLKIGRINGEMGVLSRPPRNGSGPPPVAPTRR
jgi:hypothetical protein